MRQLIHHHHHACSSQSPITQGTSTGVLAAESNLSSVTDAVMLSRFKRQPWILIDVSPPDVVVVKTRNCAHKKNLQHANRQTLSSCCPLNDAPNNAEDCPSDTGDSGKASRRIPGCGGCSCSQKLAALVLATLEPLRRPNHNQQACFLRADHKGGQPQRAS